MCEWKKKLAFFDCISKQIDLYRDAMVIKNTLSKHKPLFMECISIHDWECKCELYHSTLNIPSAPGRKTSVGKCKLWSLCGMQYVQILYGINKLDFDNLLC